MSGSANAIGIASFSTTLRMLAWRWKEGIVGPLPTCPCAFLPSMDPCHQEAPLPLEEHPCTQCDMKHNPHGRTRTRMWLPLWARGVHLQLAHPCPTLHYPLSVTRAPGVMDSTPIPSTRERLAVHINGCPLPQPPALSLLSLLLPHGIFHPLV